jgi:hypothetical protein
LGFPNLYNIMSCSPEVVSWQDECIREEVEEAASTLVALSQTSFERQEFSEEHSHSFISFKDDINDKSGKTTFRGHHLPNVRHKSSDCQHGYEIQAVNSGSAGYLKKTKDSPAMRWSSAIICGYDPKRDNIMFEVSSKERGYSYHTMKMIRFEKLISINQITIKKI